MENAAGTLGHAFRFDGEGMADLGTLGGETTMGSSAVDISEDGDIVGVAETASGDTHAVLWRGGETLDLGPEDMPTHATGIDAVGGIIGWAGGQDDAPAALLWTPAT